MTAPCSTRSRGPGPHLGPGGQEEGQRIGRHTVDGDRPAGGMGRGHRRDHVAEIGEAVVTDDHLRRPDRQAPRRRERRVAGEDDVLGQPTVRHGVGQQGRAAPVGERRGVGDPGDAVSGEVVSDGGEVEGRGGPHRGQRLVLAENPARLCGGADVDARPGDGGERGRVQDPQGARCVLDPHGNGAGPGVEPGPVDAPAGGVMAHGSEPLARGDLGRGPTDGCLDALLRVGQVQG